MAKDLIRWGKEARDLAPDPVTSARLTRLSGSSIRTENIYCDDIRATADGKRLASWRYVDHLLTDKYALLVHDLETKWTGLIDREVTGHVIGPPWGGSVYYPSGHTIRRASLVTGEVSTVFDFNLPGAGVPKLWQLMNVSRDESVLYYVGIVKDEPEMYNLVRVELPSRAWHTLLDTPRTERLGMWLAPFRNDVILVSDTAWDGPTRYGIGMVADAFARNPRRIFDRVHHGTWLADTGKLAMLHSFDHANVRHLPERPDGELTIYSIDGTPPKFIPTPEHLLYHISSSRCGKYVVSESLTDYLTGPMPIVVVNVETGKYRTLIQDCKCTANGDSGRQANPYFTADTKHIIFNADPDGVVNVYAAAIPDGFLESLD